MFLCSGAFGMDGTQSGGNIYYYLGWAWGSPNIFTFLHEPYGY